jgi:hypothetical protein
VYLLKEFNMKFVNGLAVATLAAATLGLGSGLGVLPAAPDTQPYHNGSVWDVSFIKVKAGMDDAYLEYLSGQWKALHDAMKKEGLILSYKVITTESHSATDFDVMLMTEYKDMASMEANEDKFDAVAEKVVGDDQKQMQGYADRSQIRDVIGTRMAREIILEPKK